MLSVFIILINYSELRRREGVQELNLIEGQPLTASAICTCLSLCPVTVGLEVGDMLDMLLVHQKDTGQ